MKSFSYPFRQPLRIRDEDVFVLTERRFQSKVIDCSPYRHQFYLNGAVWGRGIDNRGFCLDFDGVDDYLSATTHINFTGPFTFIAYFLTRKTGYRGGIFSKEGSFRFTVAWGKIRLGVWQNSTWYSFDSAGSIQANEAIYAAVTYDLSRIIIYINGEKDSEYSFSGAIDDSSSDLWVGRGFNFFDGKIQLVKAYRRALTEREINGYDGI